MSSSPPNESNKIESLMKGKLFQSQSGTGDWHVTDRLSESGEPFEVNPTISLKPATKANGKPKIDFLKDDVRDMTYARRIALSLKDKTWYNPRAGETFSESSDSTENNPAKTDDGEKPSSEEDNSDIVEVTKHHDFDLMMHDRQPSLEKAWAFFEHVALYRYLVDPEQEDKPKKNICVRAFRKLFMKANKKYDKAEPNEDDTPTRLYSPIFTPHKQLGDFGLGIGLYFSTLRAFTFITLVAGLISAYNIMYFASEDYYPQDNDYDIPTLMIGSAVCLRTSYVPCIDCECLEGEGRIGMGQ